MHLSSTFVLLPLPISCTFPWFSYLSVLSCSYIMRELVAKNALASSSLSTYLSDWMKVLSSICVYTTSQTTKFLEFHLQITEWYLDCSVGFVLREEKPLFANLVSSAHEENIVIFEKPDIVELPLLRLRHQGEKAKQRRPPLKPLFKLSIGLLQRLSLSHPPPTHPPPTFHRVHLALALLLLQLPLLVFPHVHNLLLLLLTLVFLFSSCFVRRRPLSWIRVPHLWRRLTRLLS
jgi:hypothetical protein